MATLVILYGPPGVGKTTISKLLSQYGIYADCGASPDFKNKPMGEIAAEIFSQKTCELYITEGVLYTKKARINFVNSIIKHLSNNILITNICFFFLIAPPALLSKRRSRTAEEYKELINKYEIDNSKYDNFTIKVTEHMSPDDIVDIILSRIEYLKHNKILEKPS